MGFSYVDQINALTSERRLHFYEVLAHNLTVSIRGVWSEPDLSDPEKLGRIYVLNEILHRITAKIYTLRLNRHEWSELDSWEMIQGYIAQKKEIEKDVLAAIAFSYNAVGGEKNKAVDGGEDA